MAHPCANQLVGGMIGRFVDSVIGFSIKSAIQQKTSVIDSALKLLALQSLADVLSRNHCGIYLCRRKTTKKVAGITTTSSKVKKFKESLDDAFKNNLLDIFIGAGGALEDAVKTFGIGFDPAKLIVDATHLSLKGLEGDALTKKLKVFFSSTLDTWATVLLKAQMR